LCDELQPSDEKRILASHASHPSNSSDEEIS